MHPKGRGILLISTLLYAVLCAAFWFDAPWLGYVVEPLPSWLALTAITGIGPAIFLEGGIDGLSWFISSVVGISACFVLAWAAWRRWPDSEVFVAFLLAAVGIWAACGWLLVAVSVT